MSAERTRAPPGDGSGWVCDVVKARVCVGDAAMRQCGLSTRRCDLSALFLYANGEPDDLLHRRYHTLSTATYDMPGWSFAPTANQLRSPYLEAVHRSMTFPRSPIGPR